VVARGGGCEVPEQVVEVCSEQGKEGGDVEGVCGVADGDWEPWSRSGGLVAVLLATWVEAGTPRAGGPEGEVGICLMCICAGFRAG